jgi:hypothetical protein
MMLYKIRTCPRSKQYSHEQSEPSLLTSLLSKTKEEATIIIFRHPFVIMLNIVLVAILVACCTTEATDWGRMDQYKGRMV